MERLRVYISPQNTSQKLDVLVQAEYDLADQNFVYFIKGNPPRPKSMQ